MVLRLLLAHHRIHYKELVAFNLSIEGSIVFMDAMVRDADATRIPARDFGLGHSGLV
jgi:hypothetical protein